MVSIASTSAGAPTAAENSMETYDLQGFTEIVWSHTIAGDPRAPWGWPDEGDRLMSVTEQSPTDLPYRYPMSPYPTGWYLLAESKDVQPGDVVPLRYFGKELVL